MENTAEYYINFIEHNRIDKVSPLGLRLIASEFRRLQLLVSDLKLLVNIQTPPCNNPCRKEGDFCLMKEMRSCDLCGYKKQ